MRIYQNQGYIQRLNIVQRPKQPLAERLFNRITENLNGIQQEQKGRFDTLVRTMNLEEVKGESALESIPEGYLKLASMGYQYGKMVCAAKEAELISYQNQLKAYDQTIVQYEQMLAGIIEMEEGMTTEDVQSLLETAKEERATFLKNGAKSLNESSGTISGAHILSGVPQGERKWIKEQCPDVDESTNAWQINPTAEDIYTEIERAISFTHRLGETFSEGLRRIENELERRECLLNPYKKYFQKNDNDYGDLVAYYESYERRQSAEAYEKLYSEFQAAQE